MGLNKLIAKLDKRYSKDAVNRHPSSFKPLRRVDCSPAKGMPKKGAPSWAVKIRPAIPPKASTPGYGTPESLSLQHASLGSSISVIESDSSNSEFEYLKQCTCVCCIRFLF